MPRLAWYVAQDANRLFAAEQVFGRTLDYRAVINPDSRDGFKSTSSWLFSDQYLGKLRKAGQPYRKIWWSAPGYWEGGNLADAAAGKYNGDYEALARDILKVEGGGNDPIEFRPWYEMNGNWFFWNWVGKEQQGAQAWRQMYTAMKNVSPRFRFEFAPSETTQYSGSFANIENSWPGDQYVDVCGLDLYWKPFESWGWGRDPNAAFQSALKSRYGLNWLENFARQHGNKPMQLSEVGVQGNNNTGSEVIDSEPFVRQLAEWCRARNVNVLWWNGTSNEGYLGDVISHNNWPKLRAAVKKHFVDPATNGKGQGEGGPPSVPPPAQQPDTPPPPAQPATPPNQATALLTQVNGAAFLARGKYPEPANGTIRAVEDIAFWPLAAAGVKNGTPAAGNETDPLRALALIVAKLGAMDGWPAEAKAAATAWADQADAILEAAGISVPVPTDPPPQQPDPVGPAPEIEVEMAALRAKVANLSARLADAEAAKTAAEQAKAQAVAKMEAAKAALAD